MPKNVVLRNRLQKRLRNCRRKYIGIFKVNGVSVYRFAVATVDIKKNEKRALLNFVKNSIYRFLTFPAETLAAVEENLQRPNL